MDIISYVHKSVELLFQILGLVEVWTRRSMELSLDITKCCLELLKLHIAELVTPILLFALSWHWERFLSNQSLFFPTILISALFFYYKKAKLGQ
jgi:hypothetical protein